ncbi:hypothetical protein MLD38_036063 [Melastoma candidum]|uniref:Uncharacterized protein n=1 Tax=Melastoma candidum TaxID=119954 RepID=A0ACB9LJ41_9MYRT|nr:hypothetical protein MLD38_036063 [Melastoma candidum]
MVGLSVVLEGGEGEGEAPSAEPRRRRGNAIVEEVISKTFNVPMLMNDPFAAGSSYSLTPPSPSPRFRPGFPVAGFLDRCFLCGTKLSPGKDIYMYRGDRGFCSEECRCRQILLEEEEEDEAFRREKNKNHNKRSSHCSSSAHPPSSPRNSSRRGSRNRASGEV